VRSGALSDQEAGFGGSGPVEMMKVGNPMLSMSARFGQYQTDSTLTCWYFWTENAHRLSVRRVSEAEESSETGERFV
jgi:hypothetical protein